MRNQKGVSLITLVITIIVVIILAAIALGGGATDSIGQADYAGFAQEIGELQDKVSAAIANAKGKEHTRGNTRTTEQLANFIARGGYDVFSGDSGDKMWLVQSDAEKVQATIINEDSAIYSIGAELPERKVETYLGTKQKVSYFVTNQGTVFCWPPYIYDGKSYIAADLTVKTSAGEEIASTDATNPTKNPTVSFKLDGGRTEVIVTNSVANLTSADIEENMVKNNVDGDATEVSGPIKAVVWYDQAVGATNDKPANTVGGVAEGLSFEGYNNTTTAY